MRLKDVTEFCPAYSGGARNDTVAFVPMEALRYDVISQQEIPFDEARGKYTFFADGDLLFAKVTPCFENGNIAVAKDLKGGIGFGSSEIFVLRAKPGLNNRYLFYVVQASPFMEGGCATMCGVGGLKRMSPLFPRTFEWEIPNEKSQRQIVAYLDGRTAAIDARVAVLEKKLAAYKRLKASVINRAVTRGLDPQAKLKDSDVDWIGKVPVGWEVARVKDIGTGAGCVFTDGDWINFEDLSNDGIRYFTTGNVGRGYFKEQGDGYVSQETFKRIGCFAVRSGDIIISRLNEPVGRACIIPNGYEICIVAVDCVVLRPSEEWDKRYFVYCSSTDAYLAIASFSARGTTMPRISRTQLGNMKLPCPPLSEQRAIADYLDAECAKIDKMAELVTREIKLYKKLKRSLINEVVTGKRKVA